MQEENQKVLQQRFSPLLTAQKRNLLRGKYSQKASQYKFSSKREFPAFYSAVNIAFIIILTITYIHRQESFNSQSFVRDST